MTDNALRPGHARTRWTVLILILGIIVFWPDPRATDACFENFKRTGAKWWSIEDTSAVTIGPALMCSQVIDGPSWRYQRVYALTLRSPGPFVVLARQGGYAPW